MKQIFEKDEADLYLIPSNPGPICCEQIDDIWPELLAKHRSTLLRNDGFDHFMILSQTSERGHKCIYTNLSKKVNDSALHAIIPHFLKLTCKLYAMMYKIIVRWYLWLDEPVVEKGLNLESTDDWYPISDKHLRLHWG